jgi:hypothetical protein
MEEGADRGFKFNPVPGGETRRVAFFFKISFFLFWFFFIVLIVALWSLLCKKKTMED